MPAEGAAFGGDDARRPAELSAKSCGWNDTRSFVHGFLAGTLVASFASPAFPCHAADNAPDVSRPGEVQTRANRVYVFVDKTGLGHQHGVEAKLSSSTSVLGASQNAGNLVFDMKSFSADTAAAHK